MNFLAHLHIADHANSHLMGNLLGDFVKGDPGKQFDSDVADGIRLHRFVDSLTDNHPLVLQQKQYFPPSLRRFAPIALDMFWDHCLALHWHEFSLLSLEQFLHKAQHICLQQQSQITEQTIPIRYTKVTQSMWQGQWLLSYQELDNINYALQRMSLRSERMQPLALCGEVLSQHYIALTHVFNLLYPQVLQQSKKFQQQQR